MKNQKKQDNAAKQKEILFAEAHDIGHGQQRSRLEDRSIAQKIKTASGLEFVIGLVADGVGGNSAGETASQTVVDVVLNSLKNSRETDIGVMLEKALLTAHQSVRSLGKSSSTLHSMSTTATLAAIHDGKLYLAHVGDSRAYVVRNQKNQPPKPLLLSLDHSWANEMVRQERFTAEEVKLHPKRDDLARYIGQPPDLTIDVGYRDIDPTVAHPAKKSLLRSPFPLEYGDVVILATDGLFKDRRIGPGHYVEEEEIYIEAQRKTEAPQDIANTLISLALGRQTDDNVSVVVLEVAGGVKRRPPMNIRPFLYAGVGVAMLLLLVVVGLSLLRGSTQAAQLIPTSAATITPAALVIEETIKVLYVTPGLAQFRQSGSPQFENLEDLAEIPLEPGMIIRTLPGGKAAVLFESGAILSLESETDIRWEGKKDAASAGGQVVIVRGKLLLIDQGYQSLIRSDQQFFNASADGAMAVFYNPKLGQFFVDCLGGTCRLIEDVLEQGQRLGYDQGVIQKPEGAQYDPWLALNDRFKSEAIPLPTYTPTVTATFTPEPTLTPTATVLAPTATDNSSKLPIDPGGGSGGGGGGGGGGDNDTPADEDK